MKYTTETLLKRFRELEENYYLDSLIEADEEDASTKPAEKPPAEEPAIEDVNSGDPAGGEFGDEAGNAGMGGMGGMGEGFGGEDSAEQVAQTPNELGKVYELNKIYYHLYTIEKLLSNSSDDRLSNLRTVVSDAFNIYKIVLNNITKFKDRLDHIILLYYDFVSRLAMLLEKYYKHKYDKLKERYAQ